MPIMPIDLSEFIDGIVVETERCNCRFGKITIEVRVFPLKTHWESEDGVQQDFYVLEPHKMQHPENARFYPLVRIEMDLRPEKLEG
jgi:hypothetical protein